MEEPQTCRSVFGVSARDGHAVLSHRACGWEHLLEGVDRLADSGMTFDDFAALAAGHICAPRIVVVAP